MVNFPVLEVAMLKGATLCTQHFNLKLLNCFYMLASKFCSITVTVSQMNKLGLNGLLKVPGMNQ